MIYVQIEPIYHSDLLSAFAPKQIWMASWDFEWHTLQEIQEFLTYSMKNPFTVHLKDSLWKYLFCLDDLWSRDICYLMLTLQTRTFRHFRRLWGVQSFGLGIIINRTLLFWISHLLISMEITTVRSVLVKLVRIYCLTVKNW